MTLKWITIRPSSLFSYLLLLSLLLHLGPSSVMIFLYSSASFAYKCLLLSSPIFSLVFVSSILGFPFLIFSLITPSTLPFHLPFLHAFLSLLSSLSSVLLIFFHSFYPIILPSPSNKQNVSHLPSSGLPCLSSSTPRLFTLFLPTVPETTWALSSFPLRNRPKREHREEYPQQLPRHAHTHDEIQPEGSGRSARKPQNRVQFHWHVNYTTLLGKVIFSTFF